MRKIYDAGYEHGKSDAENAAHGLGEFKAVGEPTWNEMAIYCQQRIGRLDPRHHQFIDDMASATLRRDPTEKQAKYLKSMFLKCGGGR
jgi:hypothetical protein